MHHYKNGVRHLKFHLNTLSNTIKTFYPRAKVYFQPILPQHAITRYTVRNILDFNRLLHELCLSEKFYLLNLFYEFVNNFGHKNNNMFESTMSVHPNPRGMGRIAQCYIKIIHNKHFNPLI